jgi:hypothetical protein
VAEARCPVCGRTFYTRTGTHRFCTKVCRERAKALQPGRQTRYSYRHQELRKQVARLVAAGSAVCARCREPIVPGEPWDLDHADDGNGYLGPSHRACNRATAKAVTYEDDPANNVFWGPPDPDTGGKPRPWSRAWWDWRSEEAE